MYLRDFTEAVADIVRATLLSGPGLPAIGLRMKRKWAIADPLAANKGASINAMDLWRSPRARCSAGTVCRTVPLLMR
jgi:hypothetical protein